MATVAAVAFVSGLLANSGGFLLAPLFVALLHMPLKRALGTSLGISLALAIPGTIVHAALGHIHWPLTIAFGIASVPFARLGAHLSMRASARGPGAHLRDRPRARVDVRAGRHTLSRSNDGRTPTF